MNMAVPDDARIPEAFVLSSLAKNMPNAILAFADGRQFVGQSMGAEGSAVGEIAFHTAMSGYQEILSDPASAGQVINFTYPHIGNCGVNADDAQSDSVQAAAVVVRDVPIHYSNFKARQSLGDYLRMHSIVGIMGVDTRAVARHVRMQGAQQVAVLSLPEGQAVGQDEADEALRMARQAPEAGQAVALWLPAESQVGQIGPSGPSGRQLLDVVVYDWGVSRSFVNLLAQLGCRVHLVAASTPPAEVAARKPQAVILSCGPEQLRDAQELLAIARELLQMPLPVFGVGLGHQIMALAAGARVARLAQGQHGVNHPVRALGREGISITHQNHVFAVEAASLPAGVQVTHESLFDGSVQGLRFGDKQCSVQAQIETSTDIKSISGVLKDFLNSLA